MIQIVRVCLRTAFALAVVLISTSSWAKPCRVTLDQETVTQAGSAVTVDVEAIDAEACFHQRFETCDRVTFVYQGLQGTKMSAPSDPQSCSVPVAQDSSGWVIIEDVVGARTSGSTVVIIEDVVGE